MIMALSFDLVKKIIFVLFVFAIAFSIGWSYGGVYRDKQKRQPLEEELRVLKPAQIPRESSANQLTPEEMADILRPPFR